MGVEPIIFRFAIQRITKHAPQPYKTLNKCPPAITSEI